MRLKVSIVHMVIYGVCFQFRST